MTVKKMLLITVAICSMTALFSVSAHAEMAWYTCTVVQAGPGGNGKNYILLTDTASPKAFENRWFQCKDIAAKEMLAVALGAALAPVPKKIWVRVDLDEPVDYPHATLQGMYLNEPPQ